VVPGNQKKKPKVEILNTVPYTEPVKIELQDKETWHDQPSTQEPGEQRQNKASNTADYRSKERHSEPRRDEATQPPLKVFLSYARKDQDYVEELRKDLSVMERKGLIRTWYDRALTAGEKWEDRIVQELNEADVIICQLTRDFIASDYCMMTELDTAIRRQEAGEAELIAYVLKACAWNEEEKLNKFQILPENARPLRRWGDRNEYWNAVAKGIRKALVRLQRQRMGTG
jgi:hypothetical protein